MPLAVNQVVRATETCDAVLLAAGLGNLMTCSGEGLECVVDGNELSHGFDASGLSVAAHAQNCTASGRI